MDSIYFTFYSITNLIHSAYFFLISLFLISIKNHSKATSNVAYSFAFLFLYSFFNLLSYSIDSPIAPLLQPISNLFLLPAVLHIIVFFFYYPYSKYEFITKPFLYLGWFLILSYSFIFFYFLQNKTGTFHFTGHFSNLIVEELYLSFKGIALILFGMLILISLWRSVEEERYRIKLMTFSFIFIVLSLAPNIVHKSIGDFFLSKNSYIILLNVIGLLSSFSFILLYLNTTKDKTSYLDKLSGTVLLVILAILEINAYLATKDREEHYEQLHKKSLFQDIISNEKSEDLIYIQEYSNLTDNLKTIYANRKVTLHEGHQKQELSNSYHIFMLKRLYELFLIDDHDSFLNDYLQNTDLFFSGYREYLHQFFYKDSKGQKGKNISFAVDQLMKELLPYKEKLERLPITDFRKHIVIFIDQPSVHLNHFNKAIKEHLQNSDSSDNKLKQDILLYLAEAHPFDKKYYKTDIENNTRLVCFLLIDTENQKVYELAYNYWYYRGFIHRIAFLYCGFILLSSSLLVFLVRLFIKQSLMETIESIWNGLHSVASGNFSSRIPIIVEDELGYLSHKFNKMNRHLKVLDLKNKREKELLELQVKEGVDEFSKIVDELNSLQSYIQSSLFISSLSLSYLAPDKIINSKLYIDTKTFYPNKLKFKNKELDVGGEISIFKTILLGDKEMVLGFHLDSAGKTIPASIGAVIYTYTFLGIVNSLKKETTPIYPEVFIHNIVMDLKNILKNIEKVYKVSYIISLLDLDGGIFYYYNFKFPDILVYRDRIVSLVSTVKAPYPKEITVNTVEVKNGDVIYIGSDGKDKIIHFTELLSIESIDEDRFPKIVQSYKDDFELLFQKTIEATTSHFSFFLSKIEISNPQLMETEPIEIEEKLNDYKIYQEQGFIDRAKEILLEIYSEYPNSIEVIRTLSYHCLQEKQFTEALKYILIHIAMRPIDIEYIYAASYCYKKIGNYKKSIECGERVFIRDPKFIKNLCNLLECYFLENNQEKVKYIWNKLYALEPENPVLSKFSAL